MRLIDADKLEEELKKEVDLAEDWKTAHEIANCVKYAETVEAVPVDWIENRYPLTPRHVSVKEMLKDWKQEATKTNEKGKCNEK